MSLMMDVFDQAAERIIREQESIIGPLAIEQAKRVPGLEVDSASHKVHLAADNKSAVLDGLIAQYQKLFGQASVEVCREAVSGLFANLPAQQLPSLLR